MIDISAVDIEALQGWIGRTETAQDEITPRLVRELKATLDLDALEADAPVPLSSALVSRSAGGKNLDDRVRWASSARRLLAARAVAPPNVGWRTSKVS